MDFNQYVKKSLKNQKSAKKENSGTHKFKRQVKTLDTLIRDDKRGKQVTMGGR